jgi:putative ABC transport system permease protein
LAVVNEGLAKRIALDEKMLVAGKAVEVIGVVRTAKYMRWDEAPRPFFYLPYSSNYASRMTLHIDGPIPRVRTAVPASDVRMLRDYFDNGAIFGVKMALKIAGVAGGGGLLLALAGLYGVVSSTVARRRREIGIRLALGAPYRQVFAMILRQGMTIAILGSAAGLVMAQLASTMLRGFVPGASGGAMWSGISALGLVLAASLIACSIPAFRAVRVDPAEVLRVQ